MNTRPRTPLISFCTVQLRTLCAAHSLATLCLSTTSGPDPQELPGFWGSMVFRHAPIPRKGSGNQQQQKALENACLELVTINGRPFKLMDDSGFRKILNPLLEGMQAEFTVNAKNTREKIGERQMMSVIP